MEVREAYPSGTATGVSVYVPCGALSPRDIAGKSVAANAIVRRSAKILFLVFISISLSIEIDF
jgi:hypothetical protein